MRLLHDVVVWFVLVQRGAAPLEAARAVKLQGGRQDVKAGTGAHRLFVAILWFAFVDTLCLTLVSHSLSHDMRIGIVLWQAICCW